jgi:hypothetical protein
MRLKQKVTRLLALLVLLPAGLAWATLVCPKCGKTYEDKSGYKFCIKDGAQLKDTGAPSPVSKLESAALQLFFMDAGRELQIRFNGFGSSCPAYAKDGIHYEEDGFVVVIPWSTVEYLLPGWGVLKVRGVEQHQKDSLKANFCEDPPRINYMVTEEKVLFGTVSRKQNNRELDLSTAGVIAFDLNGLAAGKRALAFLMAEEGARLRAEDEARKRAEGEQKRAETERRKREAERGARELAESESKRAITKEPPDEIIRLKKNTYFNHRTHRKFDCFACHVQGNLWKIAVKKDSAHSSQCKDCHTINNGPTFCKECHR